MTSELSIFAARLRGFMDFSLDEGATSGAIPALAQHADAEFNGMALVLFALQFARNRPYRTFCEARGVLPEEVAHWSEIPAVPAAAFKEREITCLSPAERTRVFHSSGTTEQRPGRHFHSAESLALYEASLWPWLAAHLRLPPEDCQVLGLTPLPRLAPRSSLAHMFDVARQRLGADEASFAGRMGADGSWTVDLDAALAELTRRDGRPLLILGTAFSFVHLLDAMSGRNIRVQLPPGSRALETGGYKGRSRVLPKAELHGLVTSRLGVPPADIVCEYGMSELSSQAYEGGLPGETPAFRFPPWARARIISPETGREVADGETGLIRVFDLANVFSVLAIQTEDLAVRRGGGFELIGRAHSAEPRGCSLMAAGGVSIP
jgi:hypothetical protein